MWDGAHNLDGIGWLLPRLPSARWTIVASILADKDGEGMLAALAAVGDALVATRSSNARALPADVARAPGRPPLRSAGGRAGAGARAGAGPRAGSPGRRRPRHGLALPARGSLRAGGAARKVTKLGERITVLAFAAAVVAAIVGIAFGAGYLLGKVLL